MRAAPRVAAIVLAAGFGRRMAGTNKLLLRVADKPLACHSIDAALASQASPVIVVVGHDAHRLRLAVAARPVITVHNPDFAQGQASSIRAGLGLVPPTSAGFIFIPADMPFLKSDHVDRIIGAFAEARSPGIFVAASGGQCRSPVLWSPTYREALLGLGGDQGGRTLFARFTDQVRPVPIEDDPRALVDIDTVADVEAFADQFRACKKIL